MAKPKLLDKNDVLDYSYIQFIPKRFHFTFKASENGTIDSAR